MKNLNYSENPDTGKSHYKPILEAARITSLNPELFNLTMSEKSHNLDSNGMRHDSMLKNLSSVPVIV